MALNNTGIPVQIVATDNTNAVGNVAGTPTATASTGQGLFDKLWMHAIRRNGIAVAETMRFDFGIAPPFHHLLDPTTVASTFTLYYEMLCMAALAAGGACRAVCGFWNYITAGDGTTLMGIGFYADTTDNLWHCFVRDSATGAAPITSVYDFATAVVMTAVHRMKVKIDGPTKTITWYIDNVQVASYTPVAALRFVAPTANVTGAQTMYGAFMPASADLTMRGLPGTLPMVRIVVSGTPTVVPPVTAVTSMSVSVA